MTREEAITILNMVEAHGSLVIQAKDMAIKALKQEPQTGHCEDCKHFQKLPYHAGTLGKCVNHWGFCPLSDWYCADFEPQESEEV